MQKIISVLCCFVLCVSLSSCHSSTPNKQTNSTPNEQANNADEYNLEYFPPVNTVGAHKIGDSVTTFNIDNDEFTYTVNSVEKTKEIGDRTEFFDLFGEEFDEVVDENGVLTGKKTAVFVNVTVQNTKDTQTKPHYMNSALKLVFSQSKDTTTRAETKYMDPYQKDMKEKSHFTYVFEPNEQVTFTLGYAVKDELLDQLYYKVANDHWSEDQTYIIRGDTAYIDLNS